MVGAWTGDAMRRTYHASPSSRSDVTSALCALPCRICRLGPAPGATPAKHHVTAGVASSCTSREAPRPYQHSKTEVKSASPVWLECCTSKPGAWIPGSGASLISDKSSLIWNEKSLISRMNSVFRKVGNLLLSH